MGPCPPIQKGQGRVVTMTVTHENSHVFELELSGFDAHGRAITETLCPTDVHKLYSFERGWVMTKNLRVGEVLRTQQGAATITAIKRKAGDHRVYNFEVEATHAYFVGTTRTLSHNTDCPVTSTSGGVGGGEWTVHPSKPTFTEQMTPAEAARYEEYWSNYAPHQVEPGTNRLDWTRRSQRTGRFEDSRVIYDEYGRQRYRVDKTDHLRPSDHTNPHLHEFQHGKGFAPQGKECVHNLRKQ